MEKNSKPKIYIFRDNSKLARQVENFISLGIFGYIFLAWSETKKLLSIDQSAPLKAVNAQTWQEYISLPLMLGTLAGYVLFFVFVYRSAANLRAQKIDLSHSPGFMVATFFIPIICLFKPYQVLKEIILKSKLESDAASKEIPLLKIFWALWLVSSVFSYIAFKLDMDSVTGKDQYNATLFGIFSSFLDMGSFIATILLVETIVSLPRQKTSTKENA